MPRFQVCLQQYVEQVTSVEIEAEDEQDAKDKALAMADTFEWKTGDDAYDVEAYAILDADGAVVWER